MLTARLLHLIGARILTPVRTGIIQVTKSEPVSHSRMRAVGTFTFRGPTSPATSGSRSQANHTVVRFAHIYEIAAVLVIIFLMVTKPF
jgi:hypothetical protein